MVSIVKHRTLVLALVTALSAPSMLAHATVVIPLSVQTLAQDSELIVIVKPGDQTSFWREGRIVTHTRAKVREVWKGRISKGQYLNVETLGGVVDGIGQRVIGAASLSPTMPYLLFLVSSGHDSWRALGMNQGVFPIRRDGEDTLTKVPASLSRSFAVPELPPKQTVNLLGLKNEVLGWLR